MSGGYRTTFVGEPDLETHTGFLLAEDEALHSYFKGLTVPKRPGSSEASRVGVWFRWPEGETQIQYPFITLDLIDVAPAYELWTSEHVVPTDGLYRPSVSPTLGSEPSSDSNYVVRPYLAFKLGYQIAVHSRSSLHDRYLNSLFFTDLLPPRPFWIGVDADNTWRRCELLDFAQADTTDTTESGSKRTFKKVYTISMLAEVPQDRLVAAWKVLRVLVSVVDLPYMDEYVNNVLRQYGEDVLDPVGTFTTAEREQHGELAVARYQHTVLTPSAGAGVGSSNSPVSPSGS